MDELHGSTQSAINSLLQLGVALPLNTTDAEIPSDYSRIGNSGEGNIGDLMGHLASYLQFLEYQTSLAEADHDAWNNVYEFEKKKLMLTVESKRRDLMEAEVENQILDKKNILMTKYAKMKLLKAILEGKRKILDSLSRELSRRSLVLQIQRGGM